MIYTTYKPLLTFIYIHIFRFQPNHDQAKALNASWALFSCCAAPSKARFRKGRCSAKNEASAQLKAAFALVDDGPRRKGKRSEAT